MAKKTFKIGERAKGGIIEAVVTGCRVTLIGKEWDFTTGSRKSSDQSNAKEFTRDTFDLGDWGGKRDAEDFLNDLTDSYHADQVLSWAVSKVK